MARPKKPVEDEGDVAGTERIGKCNQIIAVINKEKLDDNIDKTALAYIESMNQRGMKKPETLQEIPALASDMLDFIDFPSPKKCPGSDPEKSITQMTLGVARNFGLLREGMDLPLRRLWYAFVKTSMERGVTGYTERKKNADKTWKIIPREPDANAYYDSFSSAIKNTNFWYASFGVRNREKMTFIPEISIEDGKNKPTIGDMFNPALIGVEKESYFDVFTNMAKMLGLGVYASGGQSSVSAVEELMRNINTTMNAKNLHHVDIFAVSDFDPAGFNIAQAIHDHSDIFLERFGKTVDYERIAPLPKHYTDAELEQGLYFHKGKWTKENVGYNVERKKSLPENLIINPIDALKQREAAGFAKFEKDADGNFVQGLEVESLPEKPIASILDNPPSTIPVDFTGVVRMRFILLDTLIARNGLDKAMTFLLGQRQHADPEGKSIIYSGNDLVSTVIDTKKFDATGKKIDQVKSDLFEIWWQVDNLKKDRIRDDVDTVASDIDKWLDDVVKKSIDPSHPDFDAVKKKRLEEVVKDTIYNAIASDQSRVMVDFPEEFKIEKIKKLDKTTYPGDFSIKLPGEATKNITSLDTFAQCVDLNVKAALAHVESMKKAADKNGVNALDIEWNVPPVRECKIIDGKVVIDEPEKPQGFGKVYSVLD